MNEITMTTDSKTSNGTYKLIAEKRDTKNDLKSLRSSGKLPAVFYGGKTKSTPISINSSDFIKVWKQAGESSVVTIDTDGKNVDVLIHEVAQNPVTDEPIHVDFYAIDKTKKVTVSVPLEFIGESPAVKELGGTLVKVLHEIEIEGLPTDLPHDIKVNLDLLTNLDSSINIKDLVLPSGVEATAGPTEAVASISTQQEEEEIPVPADLESIEVEQKGKKEEGENPEEETKE